MSSVFNMFDSNISFTLNRLWVNVFISQTSAAGINSNVALHQSQATSDGLCCNCASCPVNTVSLLNVVSRVYFNEVSLTQSC